MAQERIGPPFSFVECTELGQMLGVVARDEQELREQIEQASIDSIYYHTCGSFLRSKYIAQPYPNDFATWVAVQVRDRALGERLAILDPFEYDNFEDLRNDLIGIIGEHLSSLPVSPRIVHGEPFYFMCSQIVAVPTGLAVRRLREFREALTTVDVSAIYYHLFDVRRRNAKGGNDFAIWLEEGLGLPKLADRIRRIRFYHGSLEDARRQIIDACDAFLSELNSQP